MEIRQSFGKKPWWLSSTHTHTHTNTLVTILCLCALIASSLFYVLPVVLCKHIILCVFKCHGNNGLLSFLAVIMDWNTQFLFSLKQNEQDEADWRLKISETFYESKWIFKVDQRLWATILKKIGADYVHCRLTTGHIEVENWHFKDAH